MVFLRPFRETPQQAACTYLLLVKRIRCGPMVTLLLLFVLLLLVGGGVAQMLFFPWIWLVSTRINKPLIWWRKIVQGKFQLPLGKLWLWCLIISSALLIFALQIAITGFVPTLNDPETVLSVMLICLVVEAVMLPLTFISGFARDIAERQLLS